jgi:hypothetical protein
MSENVRKCGRKINDDVGGGWTVSEDVLESFGECLRMSEDALVDFSGFQRMSDNVG